MRSIEDVIHDAGDKVYGECSLCLLKGRKSHNRWEIPVDGWKRGYVVCSMCDVEEDKQWTF